MQPKQIKSLGIIAGGGNLPATLAASCHDLDIQPFVIALEGQTNQDWPRHYHHAWMRLGAAAKIIKTLKSHGISDLVLIGSIKRPGFSELRPDVKAAEFLAKAVLKSSGDNNLLSLIRGMLEEEGFIIHPVQNFVKNLLAPEGVIGKYKPTGSDLDDIALGFKAAQALGALDVGQSVIVQEGSVLGLEAAEGTNGLMLRCRDYQRKGRKPILIKACKPQQDRDLDLPTIGPKTIEIAVQNNMGGIAVEAGNSLIAEKQNVIDLANKNKIFVIGLKP